MEQVVIIIFILTCIQQISALIVNEKYLFSPHLQVLLPFFGYFRIVHRNHSGETVLGIEVDYIDGLRKIYLVKKWVSLLAIIWLCKFCFKPLRCDQNSVIWIILITRIVLILVIICDGPFIFTRLSTDSNFS